MSEGTEETMRRSGWRIPVGATIFVIGMAAPLAIPLVAATALPTAWKTVISGALAVGVPEILMLVAAAIMGKEGFAALKRRIGVLVRRHGPPDVVSRARYRVGLVMFTVPLLLGWLGPYLGGHLPGFDTHPLWWHVGGDVVFATSLFVLGGRFWDKLCSLWVHGARAVFPERPSSEAS